MHIVVVGVGGVGGYYGGKIAHSGQQVSMIARGQHLEAIKQNGLTVKSIYGDFAAHPNLVTNDIHAVAPADLILICTKSWQVTAAARLIKPILQDTTMVIPLQNGADNIKKLLAVLDSKHVLGGVAKIYSKIEAPGVVSHFGHNPELIFGEVDTQKTERLLVLKTVFDKAGFRNTSAEDIHVAIWTKFMFIATVSGLGALTRTTLGAIYEYKGTRDIFEKIAIEIYTIAKAKNISLPEDAVANCMHFISKQPYDSTASTQRDIMEGRPSELENFNGYIVEEGKKLGIATPVNSFIYDCLMPMEIKARNP